MHPKRLEELIFPTFGEDICQYGKQTIQLSNFMYFLPLMD